MSNKNIKTKKIKLDNDTFVFPSFIIKDTIEKVDNLNSIYIIHLTQYQGTYFYKSSEYKGVNAILKNGDLVKLQCKCPENNIIEVQVLDNLTSQESQKQKIQLEFE
jgi:hypothetical protein